MDAAASASVGLRKPMVFASSCYSSSHSKDLKTGFGSVMVGRKKPANDILSSGFCDQGHLKYYSSGSGPSWRMMAVMGGKQENIAKEKGLRMKKTKKQLKLLKGLYKDLSTFSEMGFGLDSNGDLADQVKSGMISEATENLLQHLQRLKAEQKELKKKMKEEKARLKAAHMRNNPATCEMSSGSSSESSDSECEQVLDMNTRRHSQSNQNDLRQVLQETTSSYPTPVIPTITPPQPNIRESEPVPVVPTNTMTEEKMSLQLTSSCSRMGDSTGEMIGPSCSKKIEVCMGGKCKRSGAGVLLEEFQRVVGIEGAVSGCKCMGKCREGPNVKVVNGVADDSVRVAANSFCLGVGLEDVHMIVANFLGENQEPLGFAAAS